jgi:hypothetical protein
MNLEPEPPTYILCRKYKKIFILFFANFVYPAGSENRTGARNLFGSLRAVGFTLRAGSGARDRVVRVR